PKSRQIGVRSAGPILIQGATARNVRLRFARNYASPSVAQHGSEERTSEQNMGLCKPHSKTQKDVLFMELLEPRQLLAVNIAPLAPPDSVTSIDPKTDYLVETIANDTFEEAAELGPKALIAGTLPKNDVDVYTFNVTNSFADVR